MISNESFRSTSWVPLIVKMSCTTKNFSHKARIKLTDNKQPENETAPVWGASESEITERKRICLYCLAHCAISSKITLRDLFVSHVMRMWNPLVCYRYSKVAHKNPIFFLLLSSFIFGRMQKKKKNALYNKGKISSTFAQFCDRTRQRCQLTFSSIKTKKCVS